MTEQEEYILELMSKHAPSVTFELTTKPVKAGWIGIVAKYQDRQAELPIHPTQFTEAALIPLAQRLEKRTQAETLDVKNHVHIFCNACGEWSEFLEHRPLENHRCQHCNALRLDPQSTCSHRTFDPTKKRKRKIGW